MPLVIYQGLFRHGRGLRELLDAVAEIEQAAVVLVGEGPQEEELRTHAARLDGRAFLLPFTPPDELAALTPDADVGAIPIIPLTGSLRLSLPNKLFEYAAAELPVLAGAGAEPLRELVDRYDAGRCVDPLDHRAMTAALRTLLLDPAARERHAAGAGRLFADFGWERERERFLAAYSEVLDRRAVVT